MHLLCYLPLAMVTHNATTLEQHLLLEGESLVTNQQRKRRLLNKEVPLLQRIGVL